MNRQELFELICKKKSFLCIGLDSDIKKVPPVLLNEEDPVYTFNKVIIDATIDLAVAYKPNLAFYESRGSKGWISLEKTMNYLSNFKDAAFTIADAKRGDIGNTSELYAKAFFDPTSSPFNFDAVTVAPYMGSDSVKPFLSFDNKWIIVLGVTSNKGANDFQFVNTEDGKLYQTVLKKSLTWGNSDNMMYVVGATHAETLKEVRKIIPDHFLLIPGVGAQGGQLKEVVAHGMNKQCGLLVNASRSIIFAANDIDFDIAARNEAERMQIEMAAYLKEYGIC